MYCFMHECAEDKKKCAFYCAVRTYVGLLTAKTVLHETWPFFNPAVKTGGLSLIVSVRCAFLPSGDSSDAGGDLLSDPAEEHGHNCGEAATLYTRYHCCPCLCDGYLDSTVDVVLVSPEWTQGSTSPSTYSSVLSMLKHRGNETLSE